MTENPEHDSTWGLWLIAIVVVVALMVDAANSQYEEHTTRSCMDNVVTPDPEASDYDQQSLDFTSEIRKCLRG